MIKQLLGIFEDIGVVIVKRFQEDIRSEVEYNAQILQKGIFRGVQEGVNYAKSELIHTSIVLSSALMGAIFVMYGGAVFLDTTFFERGGVGFLIIGILSILFALILMLGRRK